MKPHAPRVVTCLVALLVPAMAAAASPAGALLDELIAYHDPQGAWFTHVHHVVLRGERLEKPDRTVRLALYPDVERMEIAFEQGELQMAGERRGDECTASDPATGGPPSAAATEEFGKLECSGFAFWRSYHGYLLGLPMNLTDAGAELAPEVVAVDFEGRPARRIEVRYGEGQPIWYFYAHPQESRLIGTSFHSSPEQADGEIIVFEGETAGTAGEAGLRLPRRRTWTELPERKVLGADVVEELRSRPASDGS